jgi:hypothetical protein
MRQRSLPASVRKLARAIQAEYPGEVEVERVSSGNSWPDRFRFAVVSPKFKSMRPMQRQDRLWDIVDRVMSRDEAFAISVILAFSPSELEPAPKSKPRRKSLVRK